MLQEHLPKFKALMARHLTQRRGFQAAANNVQLWPFGVATIKITIFWDVLLLTQFSGRTRF